VRRNAGRVDDRAEGEMRMAQDQPRHLQKLHFDTFALP
jgi:hypothetical protein